MQSWAITGFLEGDLYGKEDDFYNKKAARAQLWSLMQACDTVVCRYL